MTLRSGLSLEGVIGSKTARRREVYGEETGDCGSGVLFSVQLQGFFLEKGKMGMRS